ncbi:MAG: sigma-70 family RNA polymerase sigma factor [Pirellula sp.]
MTTDPAEHYVSVDLTSVEPNELVRRIQLGCSDSATELSNRFTPRLRLLLQRRLHGRRADAEDIAQEALARAFQSLNRFDFKYRFSTWLFMIALRISSDLLRKESRRPRSVSIHANDIDVPAACSSRDQYKSETIENVWNIARQVLVESQFSVLWLKYGEGMSIAEIAKVLHKTQIGVRVQLHRAREKLSKELTYMDGGVVLTPQKENSV